MVFEMCSFIWSVTWIANLGCQVKLDNQACSVSLTCANNQTMLYCGNQDPTLIQNWTSLRPSPAAPVAGTIECSRTKTKKRRK